MLEILLKFSVMKRNLFPECEEREIVPNGVCHVVISD